MQLTIIQPDEKIPLARATLTLARYQLNLKGARFFEADKTMRNHNMMRLTPWRMAPESIMYTTYPKAFTTYVCEVRIHD